MKTGRIIILSGPSGSGKTTLHQMLLDSPQFKNKIVRSLSATTRAPRTGEVHGKDYLFLSKEDFLAQKKAGGFLESMKVFDNFYGTPKEQVDAALARGKHVLLCIDVKGAALVSRKCPDALKIFIKTPSMTDLKKRLLKRGTEDPHVLRLRLKVAKEELKEARQYQFVVINDHLSRAFRELTAIVKKELITK